MELDRSNGQLEQPREVVQRPAWVRPIRGNEYDFTTQVPGVENTSPEVHPEVGESTQDVVLQPGVVVPARTVYGRVSNETSFISYRD